MKAKYVLTFSALSVHSVIVAVLLFLGDGESVTLFKMTEILAVSLIVLLLSLLASYIIRLSPFLGHYLFGVKNEQKSL